MKCWSCLLGQCPGGPHEWPDADDIADFLDAGRKDPTGESCACECADGPPLGPTEDDIDIDAVSLDGQPCGVCGAAGSCATDSEGRPLIHAIPADEE